MSEATVATKDTEMPALSAGAKLKRARQEQGLQLEALALTLKVPLAKLEALEADCYEQNFDIAFVRSLALSVCRHLKIDPSEVMAALPQLEIGRSTIDIPSLNASFKDDSGVAQKEWLAKLPSPMVMLALVLLLAIAAILFWPHKSRLRQQVQSMGQSAQHSSTPASASQPLAPVLPASGVPALLPALPAPVAASLPAPTAAPATSAALPPPPLPTASTAAQAKNLLEFRAHGHSWLEVLDASGQVKLNRMIEAGQVINLTSAGQLPLSVVVGRANQVQVKLRGQPFDLTAVAQGNVARFEVK